MKGCALLRVNQGTVLSSRGGALSGCLLFIVLAGMLGYFGYKFGTAYWSYFEVRQKAREALSWAASGQMKSEGDMVQKIILNAHEVEVDLTPRNIQITQTSGAIIFIVSWVREVEFPYYTLPLKFKTTLTEQKRWGRGGFIIK